MEFTDFLLLKAAALVFLAFCFGAYCGFTGRPMSDD